MPKRQSAEPVGGEIHQFSAPIWEPVLEIVGDDLSGWFMWMGEIRLANGVHLHAYKHRDTRRYLHLAVDGRAFEYVNTRGTVGGGQYVEISREDALHEAFFNWSALREGDEAFAGDNSAVERALEAARLGQKIEFDPVLIERQKRFEAAVQEARTRERELDPGFGEVRGCDGDGFYGDMDDLDEAA